jgi:hypothetical protein
MDNQPSLFDYAEALEAQREAIERVDKNADPQWKIDMLEAVKSVAARLVKFTSDDVWEELANKSDSETHEPRALGAIMKKAASLGIVVGTSEYQPSKRVACHARPVRVWTSLVQQAQQL